MISVEEAFRIVQAHLPVWGQVQATVQDSFLALTAEPIVADRDYPAINRATMDGICVSWDTYALGRKEYRLAGSCKAGSSEQTIQDGESCYEIMTGAPVPVGAGLVIPYEHLEIRNGTACVTFDQVRNRYDNIHRRGSDFAKGSILLESGSVLNGPHWGIAASVGHSKIRCPKIPCIKIISTGDELIEIDCQPLPHQVRRSNAYALKASLLENGFQVVDLDHVPDDPEILRRHYAENATRYDVLIYSGGVSKGKHDYLPQVWNSMGVEKCFHEVSQRPGKPLWFGVDKKSKTAVFGLPGNPVSSLVCLHRYFLPNRIVFARLAKEFFFDKDLTYFLPVKIHFSEEGILLATPCPTKNSGEFSALANTDGFLELPKEKSRFLAGHSFRYYPWRRI